MSNVSNVAFLVLAAIVSIVGSLIVVARHRKPSTFTTSIDDFSSRMQALAPESPERPEQPRDSDGSDSDAESGRS